MKLKNKNVRRRGLFERIDRWLCIYARPLLFRWVWQTLWIRKDEFHPSLDRDVEVEFRISSLGNGWLHGGITVERYHLDLIRRRNIAHNRTIDQVLLSA
jgi:hypothetical protein